MTARQEKEEEAFVNAGRGEQPAMWGVQHEADCGLFDGEIQLADDRDDAEGWCENDCWLAYDPCVVVVSRDGGLTWNPA